MQANKKKHVITFNELIKLPYQTIQRSVKDLEEETAVEYMQNLKHHLESMYIKLNSPGMSVKEFQALMSGIKKLEVIYCYLYDQINQTNFQEVR